MLKKICGCGAIIPQGQPRCKECQAQVDQDRADYFKEYDKDRPDYHKVYKTKQWLVVRKRVLNRDNYLCRVCLDKGSLSEGVTVHHIIPLEDDRSKTYEIDNLISLCNQCHKKIHRYYDKDKKTKQKEQKILFDLIL